MWNFMTLHISLIKMLLSMLNCEILQSFIFKIILSLLQAETWRVLSMSLLQDIVCISMQIYFVFILILLTFLVEFLNYICVLWNIWLKFEIVQNFILKILLTNLLTDIFCNSIRIYLVTDCYEVLILLTFRCSSLLN